MAAVLKRSLVINPKWSSASQTIFFRAFASKLFVKGLAFSTTEETLATAFSKFGEVLKADVVMNKTRNRSKGFGYVTFASDKDAQKALVGMNGALLEGRSLFVDNGNNARPRYQLVKGNEHDD